MTSLNLSAFSQAFINQFTPAQWNALVQQIGQSPVLMEGLDAFAAKGGQITVGAANSGTGTNGNGTLIFVDPRWFPNSGDKLAGAFTVATLGHEIGHATGQGGLTGEYPTPTNPDEAAWEGEEAEGVALFEEFEVSQQTGVGMSSGSGIQSILTSLYQSEGTNVAKFGRENGVRVDLVAACP